jgi:hypothetical protein
VFHNNKEHFEDFVSKQMLVTRDWRNQQLRRFPEDVRNEKAAARLLELESKIDISDYAWQQLEPLVQGVNFMTAISATNRDVGFRTYPLNFTAWLEHLHSNLTGH